MKAPLVAALAGAVATAVALWIVESVPVMDLLPAAIIVWALPAIAGFWVKPRGSLSIGAIGAIGSVIPWVWVLAQLFSMQTEDVYPQFVFIGAAVGAAAFTAGYGVASLRNRAPQRPA